MCHVLRIVNYVLSIEGVLGPLEFKGPSCIVYFGLNTINGHFLGDQFYVHDGIIEHFYHSSASWLDPEGSGTDCVVVTGDVRWIEVLDGYRAA